MTEHFAIQVSQVGRRYKTDSGDIHALKDISFAIEQGKLIALKGRSGSGKTTLLNCIGGLDSPTSGQITVLGAEISSMSEAHLTRWRRQTIGFIFQQMGLLPSFSAYENIDVMARLGNVPRSSRRDRILDSLEQVGLLDYVDHRPYEMSGGQQQRIAIARALVTSPRLILADEPTSELDSETTHSILAGFQRLVDETNMTIFLSSHDPIVDDYVDSIIYLRDGQVDRKG